LVGKAQIKIDEKTDTVTDERTTKSRPRQFILNYLPKKLPFLVGANKLNISLILLYKGRIRVNFMNYFVVDRKITLD